MARNPLPRMDSWWLREGLHLMRQGSQRSFVFLVMLCLIWGKMILLASSQVSLCEKRAGAVSGKCNQEYLLAFATLGGMASTIFGLFQPPPGAGGGTRRAQKPDSGT